MLTEYLITRIQVSKIASPVQHDDRVPFQAQGRSIDPPSQPEPRKIPHAAPAGHLHISIAKKFPYPGQDQHVPDVSINRVVKERDRRAGGNQRANLLQFFLQGIHSRPERLLPRRGQLS